MKLATWNVNSIRARQERVLKWLADHQPDVLCMQELKTDDGTFPVDAFRAAGYEVALAGQRTYNGVAIVSRLPITDVTRGLDDGIEDPQARLIAGTVDGIRILSVYVPNGQSVDSDKYAYKLKWLERLRTYLEKRFTPETPLIVCGDFNVAPEDRDVCNPEFWASQTLFHVDARSALERVRQWGLVETFRLHHEEPGLYSWWDYRMLSFPKNRGLRIDHIFATPTMATACREARIDREARKGKQPSDHAPVLTVFG